MLLIFDLDDTLYDCSDQLQEQKLPLNEIKAFLGAKEILNRQDFKKILVSAGETEFQHQKLAALGLKDCFAEIHICSTNEEKKQCFQKIVQDHPDPQTFVVGNRLDSEIRYGKELGLRTIYLKHGKYKDLRAKDNFEIPDYTITELKQVEQILCKQ